ncbi:hypothetical protein H5410_045508 [Solanum commersonii]|uniref:Uncharacterized protein n=1 Tax=Solanum commersonii TaxID=4109 RepID=A0A9J5XBC0_SOLCO|nr:hypothetical protein H5410_045508 [Solanum commersonii]
MRPTGSTDKGKGVASASDTYAQTVLKAVDSINGVKTPLFKGFNDFNEALDYARGIPGPNYYISPALRQNPQKTPQYNIQKDTNKIIFCDHCSSMTEAFKRLNANVEALLQENAKLMEQVQSLKGKGTIQQIHTNTQTSEPSCPSHDKMDEQGVHSPMNAKRSTISDNKDTASPVQTVAGCSSSRRRLPRSFTQTETTTKKTMLHKKKKNDKIERIIKKTLEKFFQPQGQDKHVIPNPILNPDPNGDRLVPDMEHITTERERMNTSARRDSSDDYGDNAYYQDAQDPNDDDDS